MSGGGPIGRLAFDPLVVGYLLVVAERFD